jgi:hypothetical protein
MKQQRKQWALAAVGALLLMPMAAAAQLVAPDALGGTAQSSLEVAVLRIINIFLILVGIAAVIFILVGGVQYITSQGDENKAATAKQTVLFAVMGLIVVGLAGAVVRFVINAINVA